MDKKRRGMTLIEMVVCLAIVAICLIALVRATGNVTLLSMQETEDEMVVAQVEALMTELEAAAPKNQEGVLKGHWLYRAQYENDRYVLEIWHETRNERHSFLLREGPV